VSVDGLAEWCLAADGTRFRAAARVILLDPDDKVLLVHGHDHDDPAHQWWFTVGGGLADGETPRQAALRELREETGIELAAEALVGPVFTRSVVFDLAAGRFRQDEELFYARVGRGTRLTSSGWTRLESLVLDELRWFTLDQVAGLDVAVYPLGLVGLVSGLLGGWDGVTRHLDETGRE